jgi:hypothetical protein
VSAGGKDDGAGGSASHRKEEGHPDPGLERAVSARGKGDEAGGSASHRKEEGHSDPVLERAERAMNILDDYILKQSPQKTDPVLERAERGLTMHLNV